METSTPEGGAIPAATPDGGIAPPMATEATKDTTSSALVPNQVAGLPVAVAPPFAVFPMASVETSAAATVTESHFPETAQIISIPVNEPESGAAVSIPQPTTSAISDSLMKGETIPPGEENETTEAIQGELTWSLLIAVFAVTVGSSFQFGYHTGCLNSSRDFVLGFINKSSFLNDPLGFEENSSWIWSCLVSSFAFGAIFGCLAAAPLSDKYGRRTTILYNNVTATIATVLMTIAYPWEVWYFLLAGRLIIGIHAGVSSGVATTMITELSPDNYRGTLGSFHQLFIALGILVSNAVCFSQIFGTDQRWQYIFGATFIPVILQLVFLESCPESPRYNVIFRDDVKQAEKDLIFIRGTDDVQAEMESIKEEAVDKESEVRVGIGGLFSYDYRWPTLLAVFLMVMQQMSGINAAMYYSKDIFHDVGWRGDDATFATCAMMLANVIMTIVSAYLVDRPLTLCGRRFLLLAGMTGMFFASFAIYLSLALIDKKIAVQESRIGVMLFVLLFVISFAAGPGPIPWFYVNELYKSNARASASSLACAVNWFMNFGVGLLFPPIKDAIGNFTFLIFTGSLLLCGIVTLICVPETKGKSLQEVEGELENSRPICI